MLRTSLWGEHQVVTRVRDGGRIKGSDSDVWSTFFHVWTFADGKVTRLSLHTDRNRALEAAGLPAASNREGP